MSQGGWDLSSFFGTVALGVHDALFFSQLEVVRTTAAETGTALLPAVKAAHTGMAAPAPAAASDLTEMTKPELEAALTALGISFEPRRRRDTLRKMLAAAQGGAAAAAARPAGASAPSSAADAFKQAFLQAGRTALRPEDITANVRSILNGGAHALPQTKASLDKVAKSLREVRAARESGGPLPAQRHRCVEECLKSDDPVMVGLILLALQVDLDTRLQRLATLHEAAKNSASAVAAEEPDPVLSALGEDGRNRLMWEYYKAYIRNRPKYGKPVAMSYKPGSYLPAAARNSGTSLRQAGFQPGKRQTPVAHEEPQGSARRPVRVVCLLDANSSSILSLRAACGLDGGAVGGTADALAAGRGCSATSGV